MGNRAIFCCDAAGDPVKPKLVDVQTAGWIPEISDTSSSSRSDRLPRRKSCRRKTRKGLSLWFRLPNQTLKEISFLRRPFGMMLCSTAPIRVTEVHTNGHAEELGIEVGWVLGAINGEDVSNFGAEAVRVLLRATSRHLPRIQTL
uniref:PDZ domain-containing protein n=1 Tax=Noctiluca scintillans TaxID=2966 RepID=A0A7S1AVQ4_NOCSC|mmetsp:Transcript_61246/g.162809  ORF Transcript_61246/g.162809 Transcript_61246/m.162809 type:complete len:145 (+) Transcript_61246:63-497(+)